MPTSTWATPLHCTALPIPSRLKILSLLMEKDGVIEDEDGHKYIKSDVCGYKVGEAWDDGAGGKVKFIGICYRSDAVHSILTTYDRNSIFTTYGRNDDYVMSHRHGGNNGSFEMVRLTEPLTWVSGHYGYNEDNEAVIRSLKFGNEEVSHGPFGCEVGKPFSFRSTGTEIGGFHGYSSNGVNSGYLHGIGVYIRCPFDHFIDEPQS